MSLRNATAAALAVTATLASAVVTAPAAGASPASFCGELGGQWDGQSCHTSVVSERNATRDITLDLPEGFVDNPVIRNYLTTLMNNWRTAAVKMAHNSYGKEHFWISPHGAATTIVFNEIYSGTFGTDALSHPNQPIESTAYRTFTFTPDRQLALADLFKPGVDPNVEIPTRGAPFIMDALNAAAPPHQPDTYPFIPDRWTPNNVYSGGYKAWALTPDELILYMPDYPVGHDTPLDFSPGHMQWFMNGGIVQAHIPLSALAPVLRAEYGGS